MSFENWDEIRTAFQVARLGTVSGAAEVLGVHHATVIRHIDALETRLGAKLFQRHARGYTPTESGQELLTVALMAEDKFAQLAARISGAGEGISGELVVTSLPGLSGLVTPALVQLGREYPDLRLRYVTDVRVFRLEYGEAHAAIRAGDKPQDPDYVVQPLISHRAALYASRSYEMAYGLPKDLATFASHRFIGSEATESRAPFNRWLANEVPAHTIVFRTNDAEVRLDAIEAGIGIGFLPVIIARRHPDLIEVMAPRPEWDVPLWLVTHVDLHRTPKVQTFLSALKKSAKSCSTE
jgi:DNA-binding transcriptional LysR family regulator